MTTATAPQPASGGGLSRRAKIFIGVGIYLAIGIALGVILGSEGKNDEFKPQNEFKLDPWISIQIGGARPRDQQGGALPVHRARRSRSSRWIYIASRMQARPNRVQTAVETALRADARQHHRRQHGPTRWRRKWFPFIGTLFLFIWFSNMIGYIPLPTNTEHTVDIFGARRSRRFALYAATANIVDPAGADADRVVHLPRRGHPRQGLRPLPARAGSRPASRAPPSVPIFVIEVISHFVRLISLSVRLFANILAGHLLILFMGGGLVVLLGIAALGVLTLPMAFAFFIFEVGLVATLQAFIFATLTAIYLGGAVAEHH